MRISRAIVILGKKGSVRVSKERTSMNRSQQNRFYGSLPSGNSNPLVGGAGLNSSVQRHEDRVVQQLCDQHLSLNYLQDQIDQIVALGDTTTRYRYIGFINGHGE